MSQLREPTFSVTNINLLFGTVRIIYKSSRCHSKRDVTLIQLLGVDACISRNFRICCWKLAQCGWVSNTVASNIARCGCPFRLILIFSHFLFCVDHLLPFLWALVSCYLFIIMLFVLAFNILMEYSSPNN